MASNEVVINVTADTVNANRGLKDTRRSFDDLARSAQKVGLIVGAAITAIGVASVKFASDLDEARNKAQVTFGASSDAVEEFAKTAAANFGLSQRAALEYSGTLGTILSASGLVESASADMSVDLVKLAADLASFNNIPIDVALEKLRSGLVGEVEPLRTVGVLLNAAAIESRALEDGIWDGNGALTEAQKVQARYAEILSQTTKQQGDFTRTSDALANKTRIVKAQLEDAAAAIGEKLLPIAEKLMGGISRLVGWFSGMSETMQTVILSVGALTLGLAGLLIVLPLMIKGFNAMVASAKLLNAGFKAIKLSAIAGWAAVALPITAIVAGIVGLVTAFFIWRDAMPKVFEFIGKAFEKFVNFFIDRINDMVGALNVVAGLIGQEIPELDRVAIEWEHVGQAVANFGDDALDALKKVGRQFGFVGQDTDDTTESIESLAMAIEPGLTSPMAAATETAKSMLREITGIADVADRIVGMPLSAALSDHAFAFGMAAEEASKYIDVADPVVATLEAQEQVLTRVNPLYAEYFRGLSNAGPGALGFAHAIVEAGEAVSLLSDEVRESLSGLSQIQALGFETAGVAGPGQTTQSGIFAGSDVGNARSFTAEYLKARRGGSDALGEFLSGTNLHERNFLDLQGFNANKQHAGLAQVAVNVTVNGSVTTQDFKREVTAAVRDGARAGGFDGVFQGAGA